MRNVVLIGFMGAGKSRTAAELAARLGYQTFDTDALIESEAGATIAQIFATEGEPSLRAREAKAVEQACSNDGRVIACGGGTILAIANLRTLQQSGTIVYLRAKPQTLLSRLGEQAPQRPLLRNDPARTLPVLLAEREPAYRSAADLIVDTDDLSPGEVAAQIVQRLA